MLIYFYLRRSHVTYVLWNLICIIILNFPLVSLRVQQLLKEDLNFYKINCIKKSNFARLTYNLTFFFSSAYNINKHYDSDVKPIPYELLKIALCNFPPPKLHKI